MPLALVLAIIEFWDFRGLLLPVEATPADVGGKAPRLLFDRANYQISFG